MIQPEELYRLLHAEPFQPLRLHLAGGDVLEIRYPEINLVGTTFAVIGIPVPNDPDPVADDAVTLPLSTIDHIEVVPAVAKASH